MNMKKLIAAHREFGRLMGGRTFQDVSPAALAYERNWGAGDRILTPLEPKGGGMPFLHYEHEILSCVRAREGGMNE